MSFKDELLEEATRQIARQKIDNDRISRESKRLPDQWKEIKGLIEYALKDAIKNSQIEKHHFGYWMSISSYSNLFDFGKNSIQIFPSDIDRFCHEYHLKVTYTVETSFGKYHTYRHLPKFKYLNLYYNFKVA